MKKRIVFSAFFLLSGLAFSAPNEGVVSVKEPVVEVLKRQTQNDVPELLKGIWQGSDRLVMFSDKSEFALVLRVFYQWYNDRASEPASFKEVKARDRNDATVSPAEDLQVGFITVVENPSKTSGVYELSIKYPGEKQNVLVPVCVINDELYLDFNIKDSARITDYRSEDSSSAVDTSSDGFFRAASSSSGITISLPQLKKEVVSYFVHGNDIYKIRYWLSEMDYNYSQATFSDGDSIFSVDKYLRIGSSVYQCTTGRSTKIRNIEKTSKYEKNTKKDSEGGIIAFGEPYLIRVPEVQDKETLLNQVAENNKRKKPAPKPLFPPAKIDFHWKDISELEKYNPYTWNKRNLDIHK